MVVDIKQHKSQLKNSNMSQCQKNFADRVMVKFEFLNCDFVGIVYN